MAPFPLRLHWRLQAPGFFCLLLFPLFRCDPELKSMSYGVNRNDFPRDFLFGLATAAYQYEGAYLEDGKGLSNWDVFTHMPGTIMDGTTGDVADDEYHRYKEDIEILSEMGVNSYRFSIAWSRIFPGGKGEINPKGVKYYNDLIDLLIERRIQPMVTLCHYDLPQALEDLYGGFLGHQFQDDFGRYAETCFKLFGDRVKTWITFNEPATFVARGYDAGIYPPGRCSVGCKNGGNSSTEPYIATHNILCAHAKAVRIYRQRYQKEQQGIVGIVVAFPWGEPLTTDVQDIKAAERFTDFEVSWYLDPLMFGDYPSSMKKLVGERLPRVTPKLKGMLRGTLDFIGVNYYGAAYISHLSACQPDDIEPSYSHDMMAFKTGEKNGVLIGPQMTPITTMYGVPSDVRNVLNYLKDKYSSPKIIITENGFGDARNDSQTLEHILNDSMRVDYLTATLLHISKAIREDGVNLLGYHVWSLLDNFEWVYGYNSKFGLYHVNITSPSLERYPKLSGRWYSNFLRQRNATPTI
eukprot:TRINITY_DN10919_c0_g1_i1.p1 TRINITY_DN10919_c0_g1~~TRINITY_DN10919_c0_g1_i1.p1  ORF type:complete len:560 (+),score=46.86 TRINITY_DN10919_c0_g1_i1:115-1680(+)